MSGLINEFKKFILRGNVVDLAIGVVIGAAFAKIVDSLVTDIFMPIVGFLTGSFSLAGGSTGFASASFFIRLCITFIPFTTVNRQNPMMTKLIAAWRKLP